MLIEQNTKNTALTLHGGGHHNGMDQRFQRGVGVDTPVELFN
jgi:hypothetical protein